MSGADVRPLAAATRAEPVDVATRETIDFIAPRLRAGARVLEIGCGDGHVARALVDRGFDVVAIDADAEAVAAAQRRGVHATLATWPHYEHGTLDAIAFTRSLHHIGPLAAAIDRAHVLLRVGATLIVEDFDCDAPDAATLRWFAGVLRERRARIEPPADGLLSRLLASGDPEDAWRAHHEHDIHRAAAMRDAIAARFALRESLNAPYLYRYLVTALAPTPQSAALVEDVLGEEMRMTAAGSIAPVGRRLVAVRDR